MLDLFNLPSADGNSDVQLFVGKSTVAGGSWETWQKPRGKTMLDILLVGKGGNGGTGVVGNASQAGGGAGGGSGSQTRVTIPLALLPDTLFLSLAGQSATTRLASYISIAPVVVVNNTLATANGGGNGGNASAGTGGTAGTGGAIATVATMPLGWGYATALAGQAGIVGGAAVAGGPLTLPVTGLLVLGGTGGGGLPAGASAGTAGGAITGVGVFPTLAGGAGAITNTTPPGFGSNGIRPIYKLLFGYGGTGAGSTHGSATTTGLVQAAGGNGALGCGGGGNGGALTGSTVAIAPGYGGASFAIFTCW